MENNLNILRTSFRFEEETYRYLDALSDHPIGDSYIFSKVFVSFEDFDRFLKDEQIGLAETFLQRTEALYDEAFFQEHSLVVMFSDERSGSNQLTLESVQTEGDTILLEIARERGLTMDMAYLFLFYELEGKEIRTSAARITNKPVELW